MRLRSNRDFKRVYKRGKRFWNHNFTLIVNKNSGLGTRIGFSVTTKYGNAVERNRIKRQLREILRKKYDHLDKNLDMVIIPKKNTKDMNYEQLRSSLNHVIRRSKKTKGKA